MLRKWILLTGAVVVASAAATAAGCESSQDDPVGSTQQSVSAADGGGGGADAGGTGGDGGGGGTMDSGIDAAGIDAAAVAALESAMDDAGIPVPSACAQVLATGQAQGDPNFSLAVRTLCAFTRQLIADTANTYSSEALSGDPDLEDDFRNRVGVVEVALDEELLTLAGDVNASLPPGNIDLADGGGGGSDGSSDSPSDPNNLAPDAWDPSQEQDF
jgi:hypothetical protein